MKVFLLVVKILVPITLFVIANTESVLLGNGLAGVMTILVLASYTFEYFNKN
jgi:hypothetical protein